MVRHTYRMNDSISDHIKLEELDVIAFKSQIDRLSSIWSNGNPGGDRAIREQLLVRHGSCRGFSCFIAYHNNKPVGFVYGMRDGQSTGRGVGRVVSIGSHDLIEERVKLGVLSPEWLDSFDIADLQVLHDYRRQGIGEGLIRALCGDQSSRRVVLSVADEAVSARRLYHRLGFKDLFRRMIPFEKPVWVTVMNTIPPLR